MITSPIDPDNDPKRELQTGAFLIAAAAVSFLILFGTVVALITRWLS